MQNPLCDDSRPFRLPDFPRIEPGHIGPALDDLLARYERGVEEWISSAKSLDWTFVEAETEWSDALSRAWSPVSHLKSVADTAELREAYNEGLKRLTEHENWRQQHPGIYQAYRGLKDSPGFGSLSPVQRRIVDLELRDFHLAGVDLPEAEQQTYRDLVTRLTRLGSKFSDNLLDATHDWTLHLDDEERLAGLPEAERRLLAMIAGEHAQTGWTIDLSAPSFQAIMMHADDRELRREVYTAHVTRASDKGPAAGKWDNMPVIREMLELQHRLARLLGFDNYVAYALSRRMAESPESVLSFLEDLAVRAAPAARRQFDNLKAFAAEQGAPQPLEAWDIAYWSERYRQAELQLSDEELKPYFPLDHMLDALLHTAHALFGISLVPDESVATWHPDVRYYWLQDERGERFAGIFMDLFARRGKRNGAWMDVCLSRRRLGDDIQMPVAYLTCNFAPPAGGHPSLLTHHDMQTLFHEFGHCLHHLLTTIDWPQVNGINGVEWDAVELPSQLLENWCWEEVILSRYARHYETDEPLPEDLKRRLLRSHRFQKALFLMRQLEYAICDLRLHLDYDPENPADPLAVIEEVRRQVAIVPVPEWNRFLNSFSHIFGGGYSAGYYSYLWAEQLAADAWGRFHEEGVLSRAVGADLQREILAVGASRPAMDSFVAFHGRRPELGPLLESYGLS
ncbi:MAG: M3 family metallopeptidase [Lysobacterales bacterium]|jgi:oligopeptidase A